jgi:hypothetical protein
MKYAEYQVWFHTFNNAITALSQRTDISMHNLSSLASDIADKALDKFKNVKMPDVPTGIDGGIDFQGLVNQVAQKIHNK